MTDLYLERIGLINPTIVERDNNGKIERLESVGLDMASLVAFWRRCFDLNGHLFEKITLHCKSKDFNAMSQRTLETCRNVRELLAEQGVECVIDDEWFENRKIKNEEVEKERETAVFNFINRVRFDLGQTYGIDSQLNELTLEDIMEDIQGIYKEVYKK